VLLGILAFVVSLILYMPARFAARSIGLPAESLRMSGTIWTGYTNLDDTHRLSWETSGWASLQRMALVVNWHLTGPDTDLLGRLAVPLPPRADRAKLDALRGRVGWPLVEALLPGLTIRCDAHAALDGVRVTLAPGLRSAAGEITAPAGTCINLQSDAPPVATPNLSAVLGSDATGLVAVLVQSEAPTVPLATAKLTNADQIVVTIHAAGAAMVPGMPASADSEIEMPLSTLFP
jgi:hypothetical protein